MILLQIVIYVAITRCVYTFNFYDYAMDFPTYEKDFRRNFLNKKRIQRVTERRVNMLAKNSTDAVYLDGIAHFKHNNKKSWYKIREIEKDFKLMISMRGVIYNYKRDMHWRTWREVVYPNNSRMVYCYRCDNFINVTCDSCNKSALWIIEEKPPCPYELFRVQANGICGIDYRKINRINKICPEKYTLNDLSKCNNPIETIYRINRDYATVSKRYKSVICGDEYFCVISTTYEISSDQIVFKIINASNTILYSKIMQFSGNTFYCVEQCGQIDPVTKKVTNNETPLVVNLLDTQKKKKRENFWSDLQNDGGGTFAKKAGIKKNGALNTIKKIIETMPKNSSSTTQIEDLSSEYRYTAVPSTMSECMKLRTKYINNYDDIED